MGVLPCQPWGGGVGATGTGKAAREWLKGAHGSRGNGKVRKTDSDFGAKI